MKVSWQTKADGLVSRWFEVGERVHYHPPWIQRASANTRKQNISPSLLDFARVSAFGGSEWYSVSRNTPRLG
jgi:hypothetical protein